MDRQCVMRSCCSRAGLGESRGNQNCSPGDTLHRPSGQALRRLKTLRVCLPGRWDGRGCKSLSPVRHNVEVLLSAFREDCKPGTSELAPAGGRWRRLAHRQRPRNRGRRKRLLVLWRVWVRRSILDLMLAPPRMCPCWPISSHIKRQVVPRQHTRPLTWVKLSIQ